MEKLTLNEAIRAGNSENESRKNNDESRTMKETLSMGIPNNNQIEATQNQRIPNETKFWHQSKYEQNSYCI